MCSHEKFKAQRFILLCRAAARQELLTLLNKPDCSGNQILHLVVTESGAEIAKSY